MGRGARRLVLASASPRRRALLEEAGLRFEVIPAGIPEESPAGVSPSALARDLAVRKARACPADPPALVLAADTVVALDGGRLLDKPRDREEAAAHLRALSGTTHSVITGVCLREIPGGAEEVFHAETRVTMRPLAEEEVRAYAASGEGLDKAGGYAIQEGGDRFVTALVGSRTNVVGLPVEELLRRLAARGWVALAWLLLCLLPGCSGGAAPLPAPPPPGPRAPLVLHLLPADRGPVPREALAALVEVVADPEGRSRGLMGREGLAPDSGMLFAYPVPSQRHFWMKNVRMALVVAFLDRDGRIVNIEEMAPEGAGSETDLPMYDSRGPVSFALEMAGGWFASKGLREGDRVDVTEVMRGVVPR